MGRKTVFNEQLATEIIEYISLGYTLKDTAYAVGISDETIRRWRTKHQDFNKKITIASNEQWNCSRAALRRKHPDDRIYRRQKVALNTNSSIKSKKPVIEPLKPSKKQFFCGLPIRPCTPKEMVVTPKYYNASTGNVEWIDIHEWTKRPVLHSCPSDIYEEQFKNELISKMFSF